MPFIPDNQSSSISTTDSPQSSGRFIPNDTSDNISTDKQNQASGPLATSLGALAGGSMKMSESILNTLQGATNIVGNTLSTVSGGAIVPPSQVFSDTAKQIEKDRMQYIGNQNSIHGKVLENIAQLPGLIAMVGSGNGAGLLGKGTLEAFAGQAALQAQPSVQGQDLKTQIGSMAWQGTKGAMFGAVIGKAAKMGPISGPALAGLYTSASNALEGGDPNDILAGAITGAGMVTMSNPKFLASVLTAGGDIAGGIKKGAGAVFNNLKTEGPLTTAANIIGQKGTDFYQAIKTTMDATDKIEQIDQGISGLKNEQQSQMDDLKLDTAEQQRLLNLKQKQEGANTEQALTTLGQQKASIVNKVQSILENKKSELSDNIDEMSTALSGNIKNVIFGLKRGGLKTIFSNISTAFDNGLDAVGAQFNSTSQSPLTKMDLIDAHTAALSEIADSRGNIPGSSPVIDALNRNLNELKSSGFSRIRGKGVSSDEARSIQESIMLNEEGGNSLSSPVEFKTAKAMFDTAKNAEPYGSNEADIVRKTFGELIERKLRENGQDTTQFQKMMGDMSDAISAKTQLSRIFQLKQGIFAPAKEGYNFLEDIANGKGESMSDGSSMPKLIDVLEKGIDIGGFKAKGLGDITSMLSRMGENLNSVSEQYKNIGSKEQQAVSNIGKLFVDRVTQAKLEGKLTQERLDLEHKRVLQLLSDTKEQLTQNVNTRMEQLKGDRIKQNELLQRKADIGNTINAMGVGVGAYVYKLGAVVRLAGRLTARKNTGFGKKP